MAFGPNHDYRIPEIQISREEYERQLGITPAPDQTGATLYGCGGPIARYVFIEPTPEEVFYSDGLTLVSKQTQVEWLEKLYSL